jgi:hypothetical protein
MAKAIGGASDTRHLREQLAMGVASLHPSRAPSSFRLRTIRSKKVQFGKPIWKLGLRII